LGGDTKTLTGSGAYTSGWTVLMSNVTGLSPATAYFVVNPSGNTFQVAATSGGVAITGLSSGGTMSSGRLGGGAVLTLLNHITQYYPTLESLAAGYDSQRAGIGLAPLTVESYEGFYEQPGITSANCDAIGLSPSGSGAGSAFQAITAAYAAWLVSNSAQQFAHDYCTQFSAYAHLKNPSFFVLTGSPQTWSLLPVDITSTPYKVFDGARLYSNRKRRLVVTA
jgi:hypothetical protein